MTLTPLYVLNEPYQVMGLPTLYTTSNQPSLEGFPSSSGHQGSLGLAAISACTEAATSSKLVWVFLLYRCSLFKVVKLRITLCPQGERISLLSKLILKYNLFHLAFPLFFKWALVLWFGSPCFLKRNVFLISVLTNSEF